MMQALETLLAGGERWRVARAADAVEKASRGNPALLAPHKAELLGMLAAARWPELRWHLAQMVPRLPLGGGERQLVAMRLQGYLEDRSSIVKTCALQGLFELAEQDRELRPMVEGVLECAARNGTAAMRARVRKLRAAR